MKRNKFLGLKFKELRLITLVVIAECIYGGTGGFIRWIIQIVFEK